MIWLHCGSADDIPTTLSLCHRVLAEDANVQVLITAEADVLARLPPADHRITAVAVPQDSPIRVRAFLDEWAPEALIWIGGSLRQSLLRVVERMQIPATLINAQMDRLLSTSARWRPGATRTAVQAFRRIMTADGSTATRLRRGGVPADIVVATGPILEEPLPPSHDQNEFSVMAEAIGTRPCWYAVHTTQSEVKHMAAAHLAASRKSHRMLLLITPKNMDDGPNVAATLRQAGLQVGLRSEGDDPLPEHQAYVADLPEEEGLWYRVAPLTFIGGSMSSGANVTPFEPITVGSAVLHATRLGRFTAHFERLATVQACREVRTAAELGIAVGALSSPEQCARFALAGWDEVTRNAEIFNGIIQSILGEEAALT